MNTQLKFWFTSARITRASPSNCCKTPSWPTVLLQEAVKVKYDHLLLAILDKNPYLSDASKQV
jgi:hypothetical protein